MKIITTIGAAAAILALAGCKAEVSTSSDEIDASKVESAVATAYSLQNPVDASEVDVSCPDALPAEKDAKIDCDMTASGTTYDVTATFVGGDSGHEVDAHWTATGLSRDHVATLITGEAAKQGLQIEHITCDDDLGATAGSSITCSATDTDGGAWDMDVTSTGLEADGKTVGMHWNAKRAGSTDSSTDGSGTTPSASPSADSDSGADSGAGAATTHGSRYPDGNGDVTAISLGSYLGEQLGSTTGRSLRVTCPAPLEGAAGSTVTCSGTDAAGGSPFDVKVVSEGTQSDGQIGFSFETLE